MSHWDDAYRKTECVWGERPDWVLEDYMSLLPKGEVLDIGIGEGRNALFLASRVFSVVGYDLSKTAVDRCLEKAKKIRIKR